MQTLDSSLVLLPMQLPLAILQPLFLLLDPTKHTIVFCLPKSNTYVGKNNDNNALVADERHDQHSPYSPYLDNPPDDRGSLVNEDVANVNMEHALIKAYAIDDAMSEGEESMVEETPGACIK